LTGKPRQIEVKLKCKAADSPSTVSLYLLEPKTCQYVLGVESPLVCDLLPHADPQTGLFPVGLVDTIGQDTKVESMGGSELEEKVDQMMLNQKKERDNMLEKIDEIYEDAKMKVIENGEATSTVTEKSVQIANGVKTTTKKVIVNGIVVSTETIQEKDGVQIKQSETFKDASLLEAQENIDEEEEEKDDA